MKWFLTVGFLILAWLVSLVWRTPIVLPKDLEMTCVILVALVAMHAGTVCMGALAIDAWRNA